MTKALLAALLLAAPAAANNRGVQYGTPVAAADIVADLNGQTISPAVVNASTIVLTGTGSQCLSADSGLVGIDCNRGFLGIGDSSPDAPLEILSRSAPTGFLLSISSQNDILGGILTVLGNGFIGVNDPDPFAPLDIQSSQAPSGIILSISSQSAVTGSILSITGNGAIGVNDVSPDSQIDVVSNQAPASFILSISSQNDVVGNILSVAGNGAITAGATAPVTISSAAFLGMHVSTQAAGTAGASVTAVCATATYAAGTTFASGGGCNCGTIVGATSIISTPNCITSGCAATGWTCQVAGGTGGQCSAYAICSRIQ